MPIQTSQPSLYHVAGFPGQIDGIVYHLNGEFQVAAGYTVAAGQAVEIVAGTKTVRPMQSTGTTASLFGVAVYTPMKQPNPAGTTYGEYVAGDFVRVMRKGRVYSFWSGSTTAASYTAPNISHSSTSVGTATSNAQGSFTDAAASTTVGSEVAVAGNGAMLVSNPSATLSGLALIELNLPG